jgi:hypothetical protein
MVVCHSSGRCFFKKKLQQKEFMEKKVTIKGEEITIKFNMAVECAYEEITSRPFNLQDFKEKKLLVTLFFSTILANNPDTEITLDYLLKNATFDEIRSLDSAVSEAMTDWLHIPSVIPQEHQKEDEVEEEQPKN